MNRSAYRVRTSLLLSALLLAACFRQPETPEKIQVETLRQRIVNLKELLSPEFLDTLYREYGEMKEMNRLLTDSMEMLPGDTACLRIQQQYSRAYSELDSCLRSCNSLQKEISFIENELDILESDFGEERISRAEFRQRFGREAELMDGITERIYRGYNRSKAQLGVHRDLLPMVKRCLAGEVKTNPGSS